MTLLSLGVALDSLGFESFDMLSKLKLEGDILSVTVIDPILNYFEFCFWKTLLFCLNLSS